MNAIWDISSKAGLNLGTVGLIAQVGHLTSWLMDWPNPDRQIQRASCQGKRRTGDASIAALKLVGIATVFPRRRRGARRT